MGHQTNRRTREPSKEDINKNAETYHNWREAPKSPKGDFEKSPKSPKGDFEIKPKLPEEDCEETYEGIDGTRKKPSVLHSSNPKLYKELSEKARKMRADPTDAENLLWGKLRKNQLGTKFRQQHIINKFIVDFCSIEKALVIEVDGEIHDNQKERDTERSKILQQEGYKVIRFSNEEILTNIDLVVDKIKSVFSASPSKNL